MCQLYYGKEFIKPEAKLSWEADAPQGYRKRRGRHCCEALMDLGVRKKHSKRMSCKKKGALKSQGTRRLGSGGPGANLAENVPALFEGGSWTLPRGL